MYANSEKSESGGESTPFGDFVHVHSYPRLLVICYPNGFKINNNHKPENVVSNNLTDKEDS